MKKIGGAKHTQSPRPPPPTQVAPMIVKNITGNTNQ